MVAKLTTVSALLVSELTGFVTKAMKTAGRENPNRWAGASSDRAHGTVGQNTPRSIKWLRSKKNSSRRRCVFFLTSPFKP
jgi:hypothetical protein